MAPEPTSTHPVDENARKRFEAAWKEGRPEPIERCLPPEADPCYLPTLEELVHIELEFAWKNPRQPGADAGAPGGQLPRVESYLARFPRLNQPPIVRQLVEQEYLVRHRYGDRPSSTEYRERFPQFDVTVLTLPGSCSGGLKPPAIPGYEILGVLGRGGMGLVFKARQLSLQRLVALKVVLGAHARPEELTRFRREAEAVASLQHAHIVQIHEIGEYDGRPYFSLEFVDGGTLAQRLAGSPQPAHQAARLMETLARAIHYAHERGIVHRDLKPANILLQLAKGERQRHSRPVGQSAISNLQAAIPKITDFGLAKRLEGEMGQTHTGDILGTPSYMAPEQARGRAKEIGPCTDVYALGAVLYEMLTGRRPFHGQTTLETLEQVVSQDPVPPRRMQPKVPRDLETICLKCLEKESRRRYPSAEALAEDLRRFLAGEPIQARPIGLYGRGVKWAKRRPAIAALTLLTALITALGLGGVLWQWRQTEAARVVAADRAESEALARGKAEAALAQAEINLYFNHVALADREWLANNVAQAEELLGRCPAHLRHWEWDYLRRRCHASLLSLDGHGCVTFSPDGRRLAAACERAVKVWEAASGKEILLLSGHTSRVTSVAFSPNGKLLASADDDETVRLWDAVTGQTVRTLAGHPDAVTSVAFSPDSRLLAAASERMVKVWNVTTGEDVHTLRGHTRGVSGVAFSPDGSVLASAGGEGSIKMWDPATGREIRTLQGHADQIACVAFSPDGRFLASAGDDKEVKVWDPKTGQVVHLLRRHRSRISSVVFSPDSRFLASAGGDVLNPGVVIIWDMASGWEVGAYRGHSGGIAGLAFSSDGRRLASAGDGSLKVWDATTGQEARIFRGHAGGVTSVALSSDGRRLASGGAGGSVRVWDTATGEQLRLVRANPRGATRVALSPDGRRLVSGGADGTLQVWDATTGAELLRFHGHEARVSSVVFSSDGKCLGSASWDEGRTGEVKLWDSTTGREVLALRGATGRAGVAFSRDGRRLAAANDDKTVKVWDAETGQELCVLRGHATPVSSLAFSRDGGVLASAGGGIGQGEVKVWDVTTGRELRTIGGHVGRVTSVAFSPDGRRLISAGWDQTVKLWDPTTGQSVLTLRGHTDLVSEVTISSDGRRIASASEDGTLRVWDATPLEMAPVEPPK